MKMQNFMQQSQMREVIVVVRVDTIGNLAACLTALLVL